MREMGIEGVSPGPNLSKRNQKEGVYPYLLRHITSAYPNHIWGVDITYIRLQAGWMYLVAVLDWFSRYVVSWELDQTLELPSHGLRNEVYLMGETARKPFSFLL